MNSPIRSLVLAAACLAAGLGFASDAQAGTITLAYGPGQYSSNGGGEFKVTQFTGTDVPTQGAGVQVSGGYFQTFCLEHSETFAPGTTYNWTLSESAHAGGGGAQQDANGNWYDPVGSATAYLYTQFWQGTLSWTDTAGALKLYDYNVGSGRAASADALQKAIWYLENEQSLSQIGGTSSDAYRMVVAAQSAIDSGVWSGVGNVRVLTLTDSAGGVHQDQLFMVPLPPAAWLGFGLLAGIAAVGAARRRRERLAC
jgi:hypothetical protein